MQDMGFETYNPLLNMGGLTFVISFMVSEVMFFGVLMFLYKTLRTLRGKKKSKVRSDNEGSQKEGGTSEKS